MIIAVRYSMSKMIHSFSIDIQSFLITTYFRMRLSSIIKVIDKFSQSLKIQDMHFFIKTK